MSNISGTLVVEKGVDMGWRVQKIFLINGEIWVRNLNISNPELNWYRDDNYGTTSLSNLASALGGMKVALGGSGASAKTTRITFTDVNNSTLCFIVYKKFGSFSSLYGNAYMGAQGHTGYINLSVIFTGTDTSEFQLTEVEGSPNVFEGNMAKYSGINVFYWNCNVTIV